MPTSQPYQARGGVGLNFLIRGLKPFLYCVFGSRTLNPHVGVINNITVPSMCFYQAELDVYM